MNDTGRGSAAHTEHVEHAGQTSASWSRTLLALTLDVAAPLAVFYGARAAGLNQWLALVLAGITPSVSLLITWARQQHLNPTAIFMIAALALSLVIALFTGDPRALLARESWVTAVVGLWMIVSLTTGRPFLLDLAIKITPPGAAQRYDQLWRHNAVCHRWMRGASLGWGAAFVVDAIARVVMAYTLPIDIVPLLSVVLLIAMLCVAQGLVMLSGWRSGALALVHGQRHD